VTAVDAKTDEVIGTIPLDAKPEFAVSDGKGRVYVNLEDKNSLAVIDPQKLSVTSVWPLTVARSPRAWRSMRPDSVCSRCAATRSWR